MKRMIFLAAALIAAAVAPAAAETYSWIDDQGTYNFADDLSQVPKKYRKKVLRRDDGVSQPSAAPAAPAAAAAQDKALRNPAEAPKAGSPPASSAPNDDRYGGKTQDEWRKEFSAQEAELTVLEQQMARIRDRIKAASGAVSSRDAAALKREQDEANTAYQQKYKVYSELIESARKAGLTVNMKK